MICLEVLPNCKLTIFKNPTVFWCRSAQCRAHSNYRNSEFTLIPSAPVPSHRVLPPPRPIVHICVFHVPSSTRGHGSRQWLTSLPSFAQSCVMPEVVSQCLVHTTTRNPSEVHLRFAVSSGFRFSCFLCWAHPFLFLDMWPLVYSSHLGLG